MSDAAGVLVIVVLMLALLCGYHCGFVDGKSRERNRALVERSTPPENEAQ